MSNRQKSKFITGAKEAAAAIGEVIEPTTLQRNELLSDRYLSKIYLKREDLTPIRSYKLRGAFNFFRKALAGGNKGKRFVCASAGNHAQGFAFCCQHFDVDGIVFMPVTTPKQKVYKTEVFGNGRVEIRAFGDIFDQCNQEAIRFARETEAILVPPFDHNDIIEGQASVGLELLSQLPEEIDILIIPVGGGGLAAGVCQIMEQLSPKTKVLFVEPKGAPSFARSLKAGKRIRLKEVDNFVDGAAVTQMGALNFGILKKHDPSDVIHIAEDKLCETIIEMLNHDGIVLEPAGALGVAALERIPGRRERLKGKTIVCITSGGNFDFERFHDVKERALKSSGLKKYFVLRLPQRPGALQEFLSLLGPDDDIARFEYLKKSARNFGSILVGVETSKKSNFKTFTNRMKQAGIEFHDITHAEFVPGLTI